ncbi:hypothetical protein SAMN04488127_1730 [Bhargavaea ginsengi]|uniref:Uncharacterized protein n=1 Tax=Bhargavaea ginsengi TaxID=426757 RepID=A0A1H6YR38_9BACL|nr:hypothetical protein [Bhargavaea ginsengi]SEJ42816.1 hypothetical protein SAMN04488127_1730 [Bhargavaea ginsengi]
MLIPDSTENLIVAVIYENQFNWYVADKEVWYLDYNKRIKLFREQGYEIKEEYIDDERQELLLLDTSNADDFLSRMSKYKVTTQKLKSLLESSISQEDDSWRYDYNPSLFIDFDRKVLYSSYTEAASYEDYAPKEWKSEYKNFKSIIPNNKRYWLNQYI